MKFKCKEISIFDDTLGCEITFSEKEDLADESANMSVSEIMDTIGKYLLLQRTYPEDELSDNYYYYETHDENLIGELDNFEVSLSRNHFELKLPNEHIEILINPTEKEFNELKKILPILINNKGKLTVNE